MQKILHIIPDQDTGVAGQQLLTLHQHKIANFQALVPASSQLVQFFESYGLPCTIYGDMSAVKQAIKEAAPDIVHTHNSHELRTLAHKMGKIKTVHTQHSAVSVGFFARLSAGSISDAVIATTREARESLLQMGTPLKRIRTIYNGAAPVEGCDNDEVRQQYNIPPDTFVVTCFAASEKCQTLLDTAKELPYNVILLIAGAGDEPAFELQNVRKLGATENISELILNITNVQICLLPDREHNLLFAGMSAGKPTIATKDFDPYIIEDNVNGLVIPGFNPDDLDDAITRLKETPPLYEKLSAGALSRYRARFTARGMVHALEEVYRSLS